MEERCDLFSRQVTELVVPVLWSLYYQEALGAVDPQQHGRKGSPVW